MYKGRVKLPVPNEQFLVPLMRSDDVIGSLRGTRAPKLISVLMLSGTREGLFGITIYGRLTNTIKA